VIWVLDCATSYRVTFIVLRGTTSTPRHTHHTRRPKATHWHAAPSHASDKASCTISRVLAQYLEFCADLAIVTLFLFFGELSLCRASSLALCGAPVACFLLALCLAPRSHRAVMLAPTAQQSRSRRGPALTL